MPSAGLAARTAGYDRWRRTGASAPGPMAPAGTDADTLVVELFLGGQWVDVTDRPVYYRDLINTSRGRADESSQVERSSARFTINNRDGWASPRNPNGPYYGLIGRNTPARIARIVDGTRRYRFHGEVPAWPSRWDTTGRDVYVPVQAYGILGRLGQGESPLKSAMYRGVTSVIAAPNLIEYWPGEDGSGAGFLGNAVSGGRPMSIKGTPSFASSEAFDASASLPDVGSSSWSGPVRGYTNATPTRGLAAVAEQMVRFFLSIPAAGTTTNAILLRVNTTGSLPRWDIRYNAAGTLQIQGYDADDVLQGETVTPDDVRGDLVLANLELCQGPNGQPATTAQGNVGIYILGSLFANSSGTSVATSTVGRITRVTVNPNRSDLSGVVIGHIWVQNVSPNNIFDLAPQAQAYDGETAGNRIKRLCLEEGIEFHQIGAPDATPASATLANGHTPANEAVRELLDTVEMGPQRPDTLLKLLRECADTDMGMLYEPRDCLALGYRTRTALYNQSPTLALDYANHELADPPDPTDDDLYVRNDITVARPKGASARAELETGALSTQPPPDGVGRYDEGVTANVETDDALLDQVGWRLHLGTVDEARFPGIDLNLMHPSFTSNQDLRNGALVHENGDRITIDNPPVWMAPDQVTQIVQGSSETMAQGVHEMTLTCAPEFPYRVGLLDDDVLGRLDTDGSALAADVDATATALSVATTSGPLWTTDPAEYPFDLSLGGEVVTATAGSGVASPQTLTVTRSTNGVVKPQTAGTDIRLAQPMILGL